jgi:hypothetical protein
MISVPGAQTTAFLNYLGLSGESLAPSSFYDRFTDQFAELMKDVARRAIGHVRTVDSDGTLGRDLGELLEAFDDVRVADSTSVILKSLAKSWAPATTKARPPGSSSTR